MLRRIALITLILGFMIIIGVSVNAHFYHDNTEPDLEFTSNPEITCDIDLFESQLHIYMCRGVITSILYYKSKEKYYDP